MQKLPVPAKNSGVYRRSIFVGVLIGVILGLVFAAGFVVRGLVGLSPAQAFTEAGEPQQFRLLHEVQGLLDQHYLHELPEHTQLQYAAIRGMLSALEDRYTFFVEPPVAQSESDVLAGTYGGIGVQVQRAEDGQLLLFPFPDSPAVTAGIANRDVLLAINGSPVDNAVQPDAIDQMLRGEVKDNNGVELTIIQRASGEERTLFVPFDVIEVPSVVWRLLENGDQIGYVQILRFTSRTPDELRAALGALREREMAALVLDLRDNNGGLLQESVDVDGPAGVAPPIDAPGRARREPR